MKKEKIKKNGSLFKEGIAGDYWVKIYIREKGYTCKVYPSVSSGKIVRELTVDDFGFFNRIFVFRTGEGSFAYIPEEKDARFIGRHLGDNFYVFTGTEGKEHYFCFDWKNGLIPVFGEAEKIRQIVDENGDIHLLVYEKADSLRLFVREAGSDFWEEHSSLPWWASKDNCRYYFIKCKMNYIYAFFFDDTAERLVPLYEGRSMGTFDNAFVEKVNDRYAVYIFDGKNLVVAEEGKFWEEGDDGIRLDNMFWRVKEDDDCQVDPQTRFISEEAQQPAQKSETRVCTTEKAAEESSDCVSEAELNGKKSFFHRLGLWLGWWK